MNTIIFRTIAPFLAALAGLFSVFVLLRGHNEPGGGFIGGLIAASAFAIYGIACGVAPVRRAIYFHPMAISAFGLFLSGMAGVLSMFVAKPYMSGLWASIHFFGTWIDLSSVLMFDIGVSLVGVVVMTSIALAFEERDRD